MPTQPDQATPEPGEPGVWSVGDPNNPQPEDKVALGKADAFSMARRTSAGKVVAVWHGGACEALFFEGRAYLKS